MTSQQHNPKTFPVDKRITAEDVMNAASLISKDARKLATEAMVNLHYRGYGKFSTAMSNFRLKIEKAESDLIDELGGL